MSVRRRTKEKPSSLRVRVVSDGTLDGTEVFVNDVSVRHVQAVHVHIGPDGSDCQVTVGERVVSYGAAEVDVADIPGRLSPGPTPTK